MKKIILVITCVFLTGFAFQSCKQNDQKINTEVENVMKDAFPTIKSTAKDGVVTLSGTVETQQERTGAEQAARMVKNVKEVVNNIQVREAAPVAAPTINSDEVIKTDVKAKLEKGGYKDVKVEVTNGEVILTGDLQRSDLTKVMQIANESKPRKVTNNLKLK